MTSKQLWEAALRLAEIPDAAPDFRAVIDYVLDRVKPDDDEPVTPERLTADGWTYDAHDDSWYHADHKDCRVTLYKAAARLWTWSMDKTVKTMGHLRRLVRTLWE